MDTIPRPAVFARIARRVSESIKGIGLLAGGICCSLGRYVQESDRRPRQNRMGTNRRAVREFVRIITLENKTQEIHLSDVLRTTPGTTHGIFNGGTEPFV